MFRRIGLVLSVGLLLILFMLPASGQSQMFVFDAPSGLDSSKFTVFLVVDSGNIWTFTIKANLFNSLTQPLPYATDVRLTFKKLAGGNAALSPFFPAPDGRNTDAIQSSPGYHGVLFSGYWLSPVAGQPIEWTAIGSEGISPYPNDNLFSVDSIMWPTHTDNPLILDTPVSDLASVTVDLTGPHGQWHGSTSLSSNLSGLSFAPASVQGGTSTTGIIQLSGPAPTGGVTVALSSNNADVQVPTSVFVPAGNSSATFTATTTPVALQTSATVSAIYNGVTQTGQVTVLACQIQAATLTPPTVQGGHQFTLTISLTGPAPAGGLPVSLSMSQTGIATVPRSVTVSAG